MREATHNIGTLPQEKQRRYTNNAVQDKMLHISSLASIVGFLSYTPHVRTATCMQSPAVTLAKSMNNIGYVYGVPTIHSYYTCISVCKCMPHKQSIPGHQHFNPCFSVGGRCFIVSARSLSERNTGRAKTPHDLLLTAQFYRKRQTLVGTVHAPLRSSMVSLASPTLLGGDFRPPLVPPSRGRSRLTPYLPRTTCRKFGKDGCKSRTDKGTHTPPPPISTLYPNEKIVGGGVAHPSY